MKSKIKFAVIAILLVILVDFVYYFFRLFRNESSFTDVIYIFILSVIFLIVLLNISYKKLFEIKKTPVKFIVYFFIFLFLSVFIAERTLVINKLYFFTKNYKQNDKGSLWKTDPILSYHGIENKEGTQDYFIGDSIQGRIYTRFDSIGFRTVNKENELNYDTLNLFLGCSFTFGSYIKAEDSFSYLFSKEIKNNYINAGGSGYGAGQMMFLLDSLLKKYKFKYVFLQLSPWLTDRAMQINAPFFYFYRPMPYFSDDNGSFALNLPPYNKTSITFKQKWNETEPDYFEKFKFSFTDGVKIEINDYFRQKIAKLKMAIGVLPKPTKRRGELEKYIYKSAIDKCKQFGAIPVVLRLAYPDSTVSEIENYIKPECVFIDLDEDLNNEVKNTGISYYKLFSIYHEHNGKRIIFDTHPNEFANKIIAEKIIKTLK